MQMKFQRCFLLILCVLFFAPIAQADCGRQERRTIAPEKTADLMYLLINSSIAIRIDTKEPTFFNLAHISCTKSLRSDNFAPLPEYTCTLPPANDAIDNILASALWGALSNAGVAVTTAADGKSQLSTQHISCSIGGIGKDFYCEADAVWQDTCH
jgi:hypothetical protein